MLESKKFQAKDRVLPIQKNSKFMADHADAEIPGIETILKNDKVEEAEISEMISDNADNNLALSEILERPVSGYRVKVPSCVSDAVKLGSDAELESQLHSGA